MVLKVLMASCVVLDDPVSDVYNSKRIPPHNNGSVSLACCRSMYFEKDLDKSSKNVDVSSKLKNAYP